MRAALEIPERSAALVTRDRQLARRVAAELRRWGIEVDDSAGTPLDQTPPGAFLLLTARLVTDGVTPVALLAALKHPFARSGQDQGCVPRPGARARARLPARPASRRRLRRHPGRAPAGVRSRRRATSEAAASRQADRLRRAAGADGAPVPRARRRPRRSSWRRCSGRIWSSPRRSRGRSGARPARSGRGRRARRLPHSAPSCSRPPTPGIGSRPPPIRRCSAS